MTAIVIWLLLAGSVHAGELLTVPQPLPKQMATVPLPLGTKDSLPSLTAMAPVGVPDLPDPPAFIAPDPNATITQDMTITQTIHVGSNQHIACANNLITIHFSTVTAFLFDGVSNSSLSNCTLSGPNDPAYPHYACPTEPYFCPGEFIFGVEILGGAHDISFDHIRCQGPLGDACIEAYGGPGQPPTRNITVTNSTFTSCGLYGVALVSTVGGLIANNWFRDCSVGAEADGPVGQQNSGVLFANDTVERVNGIGWRRSDGSNVFITGGAAAGAVYNNTVRNPRLLGGAIQQ